MVRDTIFGLRQQAALRWILRGGLSGKARERDDDFWVKNMSEIKKVKEKMTEIGLRTENYELRKGNGYITLFRKTKDGTRSQRISLKEREALSKIGFDNVNVKNSMVLITEDYVCHRIGSKNITKPCGCEVIQKIQYGKVIAELIQNPCGQHGGKTILGGFDKAA